MRQTLISLVALCCFISCGSERNRFAGSGFDYNGAWKGEEFDIDSESRNKLDILIVIDKSESMQEARTTLAGKLNALLDSINQRDWKIAIATTDARDCLHAIITKDNQGEFATTINAISGGSNKEEAVKVAIKALRGLPMRSGAVCDDANPLTWRRPAKETALAIIIVTDEDHQCDKNIPEEQCTLQELHDLLQLMDYIPRITAKIYGFLNLQKVTEMTKWKEWKDKAGESIFASTARFDSSAEEYERVLKDISVGMDGIYQSRFTLKKEHDGIKSEVTIVLDDDTTQTLTEVQYGFAGKDLVIISALPSNTKKIRVNYSYASN